MPIAASARKMSATHSNRSGLGEPGVPPFPDDALNVPLPDERLAAASYAGQENPFGPEPALQCAAPDTDELRRSRKRVMLFKRHGINFLAARCASRCNRAKK